MYFTQLALIAGLAINAVNAISQISIKGSKFFTDDGNQFFVKGVAYQLSEMDPLSDTEQCKRDASLMQKLGANAIRVFHVDAGGDHQGCMDAFKDVGIYIFVDLDTFTTYILQDEPFWNQTQLSSYEKVLDEFQKYDNTAGVFVGNEIMTRPNGTQAAPYIKAAARDIKAYRDSKNYRKIPVGYSAADIADLRPMVQNYLACGTNASESLDFFSLNVYEWCGQSSYVTSGYSDLEKNATDYNIPIFFSETGCITARPRTFEDQRQIFGVMADVWSGAIVYEWIQEANNYGLVSYGPSVDVTSAGATITRSGTPTPVSPDYSNLLTQWSSVKPSGVKQSAYKPSNSAPACPTSMPGIWEVDGNVKLPSLGQHAVLATSTAGASPTGSAASATATKKSGSSGGKEIAVMSFGLSGVLLGFIWWL
ncbi:MAG: hypothetical protein M1836_005878 [Candelina mexicana]|nr:MAG: hypothetical protein M1836_005878 [Candelina mexicana]